jgi:phosphoenolpyruvate carboxykinase (ATP)
MHTAGIDPSRYDLSQHGLSEAGTAYWNLGTAHLYEQAMQRGEGLLAGDGAFVVRTGQFTGRSPKDKYLVREEGTEHTVQWGSVNQPMTEAHFDGLYRRMIEFWKGRDIFVQDCFAGADPEYTMPIRVITQRVWHSLFARQLFVRAGGRGLSDHVPEFTVFFAPEFEADPHTDGTRSRTCVAIDFKKRVVLIAGTEYAGEMKKSIFTILNYLLPFHDVLPMHCSANAGHDSSSDCPGRARRRCRRIRRAISSATTNTAGAAGACSTSKAGAMPSASSCRRRRNRRFGTRSGSGPCWRTS